MKKKIKKRIININKHRVKVGIKKFCSEDKQLSKYQDQLVMEKNITIQLINYIQAAEVVQAFGERCKFNITPPQPKLSAFFKALSLT